METITKQSKMVNRESSNTSDLLTNVPIAFETLNAWVKEKGYRLTGEIEYDTEKIKPIISNLTLNQRKKLRNSMRSCIEHPTMATTNIFLHTYQKYVIKGESKVKVKFSLEEEAIKNAKLAWKAAQKMTEELRVTYKTKKKNFYAITK